jgi:hypothetical protein
MSKTSRRSLIISATALPVMAMPAIAGVANVAPETDPIFAAIKVCVEAERADAEVAIRLEDARERFEDEYESEEPDALPKVLRQMWRQTEGLETLSEGRCSSHEAIDEFMDHILRGQHCEEKDVAKIRARLHVELDRQTAAYNETVKPLKEAADESGNRFWEASQALLETAPTSLAGLAALFACLRDNDSLRQYVSDNGYLETMVETLAEATAKFAALA